MRRHGLSASIKTLNAESLPGSRSRRFHSRGRTNRSMSAEQACSGAIRRTSTLYLGRPNFFAVLPGVGQSSAYLFSQYLSFELSVLRRTAIRR